MLFNAKAILVEQQCYYLTHSLGDKGVHAFPNGNNSKMNVKARREFELLLPDRSPAFYSLHRGDAFLTDFILLLSKKKKKF